MRKNIDLESFAAGALSEKFNQGYQEVLDNISDLNTDHKKKRKLTLELVFLPDEERELSMVDVKVKTTLAPPMAIGTKILIDKDGNGNIVASEYNKQVKGQRYMKIDEETGEIFTDNKDVDIEGIKLVK